MVTRSRDCSCVSPWVFQGSVCFPTTKRDQDGPSPAGTTDMPCYTGQHRFYCGVDLHARTMYTHVLDAQGKTVFEQDLPTNPDVFLGALAPFRPDLVVGAECMFSWY